MELAAAELGDALRWLPDGETGERINWVASIVQSMYTHPDLELERDGDWSSYDKTPVFRVRRGHKLDAESLQLGHVEAFRESLPEFRAIRAKLGRPELRFQVGIPGDFDLAGIVLGPWGAIVNRKPFHEAAVDEVRTIFAEAGDEVTFQLEVPFELVFAVRSPSVLRPVVTRLLARRITAVARNGPAGARYGVHLCLGDMNHEALARMTDVSPLVALANAVLAAWPDGRELEYVHAPFEGASHAPPLDPAYYAPLRKLKLPADTHLIAGFVYEHQSLKDQQRVLGLIEDALARPVDVSAACGLGRRSLDEAVQSMRRARQLATA
jgi:hypothetical protein